MALSGFQLESLSYQTDAVKAVVEVFSGTPKRQPHEGTGNRCPLSWREVESNIRKIALRHRISDERLHLSKPKEGQPIDACIEMETGTGKTLVYLRTLYRLHTMYGWNKFIIAVPSVAIRAGVMGTLADFGLQLAQASGLNHPIPAFEYDSSRLQQLNAFIAQKESSLFSQLNSQAIRDEVLFKCGFQLDVQLEPINEVSANQLFQARDQQSPPREAIVCFDTHLSNTTLDWLCKQRGQRVIVLETALDTTSKWNLHHHLGDGLFVF